MQKKLFSSLTMDVEGKCHDVTSKLAQPEYRDHADFARLELNKDDY
jgi:hypothetical protein